MPENESPIYKLPYPGSIGPVAFGAADFQELAEKLDTILYELSLSVYSPGDLKLAGYEAVPTGWLLCDGSAVSRTTFATLYAALGGAASPWGQGNGTTTFNVPDGRGRMLNGTSPNARGATGGVSSVTLTAAQCAVAAHTHPTVDTAGRPMANNNTYEEAVIGGSFRLGTKRSFRSGLGSLATATLAHTNMPQYFVVNWFIKT